MKNFPSIVLLTGLTLPLISCKGDQESNKDVENKASDAVSELQDPAADAANTALSPNSALDGEPPETDELQPLDSVAINASSDIKPLSARGTPEGFSSWDEFNPPNKPELMSLFTWEGKDQAGELFGESTPCSVFVLARYLDNEQQVVHVVRTSFSHNSETHPYLLVKVDPSGLAAQGTDASGRDQVYFELEVAGDFSSASSMRLKWFHLNHFDTGVCTQLSPKS